MLDPQDDKEYTYATTRLDVARVALAKVVCVVGTRAVAGMPRRIRRGPRQGTVPTFDPLYPAGRVQIVDRTTSPASGPHHPGGDANLAMAHRSQLRAPPPVLLLPDSFSNRICRWLHHIHPIRRHPTPHTHLRNRPSCLVQLKIARDAPRLLGFPT